MLSVIRLNYKNTTTKIGVCIMENPFFVTNQFEGETEMTYKYSSYVYIPSATKRLPKIYIAEIPIAYKRRQSGLFIHCKIFTCLLSSVILSPSRKSTSRSVTFTLFACAHAIIPQKCFLMVSDFLASSSSCS